MDSTLIVMPQGCNRQIYIAGPMSGIQDLNFPLFCKAERELIERGWLPINPASKEKQDNADLPNPDKMPIQFGGNRFDLTPGMIHQQDAQMLMSANSIGVLPGWQQSLGSLGELYLAQQWGLYMYQIFPWDDILQAYWTVKPFPATFKLHVVFDNVVAYDGISA
jgi:hypothetical protein